MTEPKRTLKGTSRRIVLDVTAEMIERAEQANSSHCMIAAALRVALPEVTSISVDLVTIRFTDPKKRQRYIYLTPEIAQQALVDFDQGRHNEPFKFQLRQAVQVVASGGSAGKKNPPRAIQGTTRSGAGSNVVPTILGGQVPPVGALSSKGSRRKPGELTAAEKQHEAAMSKARAEVAARDQGEPVTATGSNITLKATPSRVRSFGMRQLRP